VSTALSVGIGTARAYLADLVIVGVIAKDGSNTELTDAWAHDDYAEACAAILERVYPHQLRRALPPPDPGREACTEWFITQGHANARDATSMARVYRMLCHDAATVPRSAQLLPHDLRWQIVAAVLGALSATAIVAILVTWLIGEVAT
jgi:hypothetical protein